MSIASPPKLPSERSFGFMLTAVFAVLGTAGIVKDRSWIVNGGWFLASIVCGLLSLTNPRVLAPLNKAW